MTQHPIMTDAVALALHRKRTLPDALFLHAAAADEVDDRIAMVNKPFSSAAIVTGFPEFWSGRFPSALCVPESDVLALEQGAHDLVVHAMALHWSNDPVGQLIQSRRALKPDGLFISAAFGGRTLHELRACLGQAEAEVTGGMSPRVAPMADLRDMGGLLQRAGFTLPVADTQSYPVEYADAWALMRDLRAMGESNALAARLRKSTRRAVLNRAVDLYHQTFKRPNGRITATFELIFLTGWAPAPHQQKPLRPGSAQHRLADALGTDEKKLSD